MKDKTQYETLMEELQKMAENFRVRVAEIRETLAQILPDVEIPEEEEDTWEMKCPYKYGDKHYCIQPNGTVFADYWEGIEADNIYFSQGNVFPTEEAAELESKRRKLLTRFRAFRDECNNGWKADWETHLDSKYYISSVGNEKLTTFYTGTTNNFQLFGFFKNEEDCVRAIELFGNEIKELFVEGEGE